MNKYALVPEALWNQISQYLLTSPMSQVEGIVNACRQQVQIVTPNASVGEQNEPPAEPPEIGEAGGS